MLSSVLRSARAVEVNIAIMRTFVQLRRLMDTNCDLARKIEALEKKYDEKFAVVFEAIKQLITPPEPPPAQNRFSPVLGRTDLTSLTDPTGVYSPRRGVRRQRVFGSSATKRFFCGHVKCAR